MKVVEVVPEALAGERVDRVVAMLSACSRTEAAALVDSGAVLVDGAAVTTRAARVALGATIEVEVPERQEAPPMVPEPDIALTVVHEDEHLLIIDKQPGLVVHPGAGQATGTLVHALLARYPEIVAVGVDPRRPGIVHRLDKGTSGLMLVARSQEAYEGLVEALSERRVHRRYRTLVWGHLASTTGLIDAPIGRSTREPTKMAVVERGKEARTRYEVLRTLSEPVEVTELACTLETGRTHQIRVHLRSIGHAVVGDAAYGGARQSLPVTRPFLHAEELELAHPVTGEALHRRSELPADLVDVLARLSG